MHTNARMYTHTRIHTAERNSKIKTNRARINEQATVTARSSNNIASAWKAVAASYRENGFSPPQFGAHIGLASLMCVRRRFQLLIKTGRWGTQGEGYWSSRSPRNASATKTTNLAVRQGERRSYYLGDRFVSLLPFPLTLSLSFPSLSNYPPQKYMYVCVYLHAQRKLATFRVRRHALAEEG